VFYFDNPAYSISTSFLFISNNKGTTQYIICKGHSCYDPKLSTNDQRSINSIQSVLFSITALYHQMTKTASKYRHVLDRGNEDIADMFLDEVIAAKKAGLTEVSAKVQELRMAECKPLKRTDAI